MSAPDNPPAFPVFAPGSLAEHPGMSLRDWFAGQALATVIQAMQREAAWDPERALTLAAKGAYLVADAMLIARQEGGAA